MVSAESDVYITVGMEKRCQSPLQGKSNKTHRPALSSANKVELKPYAPCHWLAATLESSFQCFALKLCTVIVSTSKPSTAPSTKPLHHSLSMRFTVAFLSSSNLAPHVFLTSSNQLQQNLRRSVLPCLSESRVCLVLHSSLTTFKNLKIFKAFQIKSTVRLVGHTNSARHFSSVTSSNQVTACVVCRQFIPITLSVCLLPSLTTEVSVLYDTVGTNILSHVSLFTPDLNSWYYTSFSWHKRVSVSHPFCFHIFSRTPIPIEINTKIIEQVQDSNGITIPRNFQRGRNPSSFY